MNKLIINQGFFTQLSNRFEEGGSFFMTLILLCFLMSIYFIIQAVVSLKKDSNKFKKMIALASDTSLLGLVVGFLGSLIGMITAFDSIDLIETISPGVLASGLKVSFLTTVFGVVTFILSRIGIVILKGLYKE